MKNTAKIPSLFLQDAEYLSEAGQLLPFPCPNSAAVFRAILARSSDLFPVPTCSHKTNI